MYNGTTAMLKPLVFIVSLLLGRFYFILSLFSPLAFAFYPSVFSSKFFFILV